jgi:hypothetical protein
MLRALALADQEQQQANQQQEAAPHGQPKAT